MPKVSKIKLKIATQYGEDYEIHYNSKKLPLFSIKGLPYDFTNVTGIRTYGFNTEQELTNEISSE